MTAAAGATGSLRQVHRCHREETRNRIGVTHVATFAGLGVAPDDLGILRVVGRQSVRVRNAKTIWPNAFRWSVQSLTSESVKRGTRFSK